MFCVAVACQRRSYSTFLTLMVWLLTAQDLLLLDSGEEEEEEVQEEGLRVFGGDVRWLVQDTETSRSISASCVPS